MQCFVLCLCTPYSNLTAKCGWKGRPVVRIHPPSEGTLRNSQPSARPGSGVNVATQSYALGPSTVSAGARPAPSVQAADSVGVGPKLTSNSNGDFVHTWS